jgi:hypothetical protein
MTLQHPALPSPLRGLRSRSARLPLPVFLLMALLPGLAFASEPSPVPQGSGAEGASGATEGSSPLVGTWKLLVADDLRPDGTQVRAYGDHPQGILMIDRSGQYSLQLFRTERPKFASGDKRRGTPQEYEAAVLGMSSHIGHCELDPASGIVTFRIDLAAYPNWDGTVQRRQYRLEGDVLSYQIPAAASSGGNIPISVWKKVR